MPEIITIETTSLGDRTYLIHDGEQALVVDPMRDIDRVLQRAQDAGVTITDVFETHIHNDYVTGGLALARESGATYHVNAEDPVRFERNPVRDGDELAVGSLQVRAIATPGHTFTHLSYAVGYSGADVAVCTGGSLLFGTTGRPDLLGPEHTDDLARRQHASVHRLVESVDGGAAVLPTHGFGSFCAATSTDATSSTIAHERATNPAMTTPVDTWVRETIEALGPFPAYYAHMGPANLSGPAAPDLADPRHADLAAIARALGRGDWVVDLRSRTAWAAGHVRGSISVGLDGQFSTWVGWLRPWTAPLVLLGESADEVAEAQRELVRIGIDELAGAAVGEPSTWTDSPLGRLPRADFAGLADARADRALTVLDVRQDDEHATSRLPGSLNIPLHTLPDRVDDLPEGEIWVHCESGYRASIAVGLLAARGRECVLVDADFSQAQDLGLTHS